MLDTRSSTRGRLPLIAVAIALALPTSAAAQTGDRQVYEAQLTTQAPGGSSGLTQRITYVNPDDPNAKPPAVSQIVFRLPEGTRVDTTVPAQCTASDAAFQLQGAAACPPETKVGVGSLTADTGSPGGPIPRVLETVVTFFNNQDQLILFAESTNTSGPPIRFASRIAVRDNTFTSTVPPIPGAPPGEPFLALKDVFNDLQQVTVARDGGMASYITTPTTCPADGQWTITASFTYRDGVTQDEQARTPCTLAAGGGQQGGGQGSGGSGGGGGGGQGGSGQGGGGGGGGGQGGGQGSGGGGDTPVGGVDAGLGGFAAWLLRPPEALRVR